MRAIITKAILALWLLVSGACLSLDYIQFRLDQPVALIDETRSNPGFVWFATALAFSFVDKREPGPQPDISPAASGVSVILLTGIAAALGVGWRGEDQDVLLAAFILFATVIMAAIAWPFARKNATMIGEARFSPAPQD